MAISLSNVVSSSIPTLGLDSSKRSSKGSSVMMCATNHVPAAGLQIRSYDHNKIKVFEDKLNGIVCYKDENGEMICEGYDEGPRFSQQISRCNCNSSCDSGDAEIIDLLQRCWLHASDEKEMKTAETELAVQNDFLV